ncbi:MAG: hypothetical protein AAGF47_05540, partial [Planctomycetota bacterium]
EAALNYYRYAPDWPGLLDWATARTGLADPLSRLSRTDLESAFASFGRALDRAAGELSLRLVKQDPASAARIIRSAPPRARAMLRSLAGGR